MKIYFTKKDAYNIIAFYFIIILIIFFSQRKLMYPANTSPQISSTWKIMKNSNNKNIALEINSNSKNNKIILVFHGNGGNANDRIYYRTFFPKDDIIIAEYPGYGFRYEEKTNKENIIKSAKEIMEIIQKRNKQIVLVGESLGTGVASQLASDYKINNLLLITPYTSILDVAQQKLWFFPVKLLLKDNYDNIENLKYYNGKTALIIAEKDNVISPTISHTLYNSIQSQKIEISLPESQHNDFINYITKDQLLYISHFFENH